MHKEMLTTRNDFVIHEFLTADECASYVALTEKAGYGDAPLTTVRGPEVRKDIRNNMRVILDDEALAASLFERAKPYLPEQIGDSALKGLNERLRLYRYDAGQTFAPHYDGSFQRSGREKSLLTFMVYLNDDFAGGTTNFFNDSGELKRSVEPETGMALVFVHLQLHEGAVVTAGRKYVLRSDVMFRQ